MRNKTTDLRNHLFAQLERLSDEDLSPEELKQELDRSKAMVDVSKTIVDADRMTIEVMKLVERSGGDPFDVSGSQSLLPGGHQSG
jgi:hypothetical protein